MNRLCCYSLSLPPQGRDDLVTQLVTSVSTLREHNPAIPVVLFMYGPLPPGAHEALESYDVKIWQEESYAERMAKLNPTGWRSLNAYPLLHKFLNFTAITALEPDQVLLLDCDTLFMGDVEELFEKYDGPDCVAREEVGSRRSHYGYDPSMVDEDRLHVIGADNGVTPAPPFNLGVVLLNNGLWRKLSGLAPLHVNYAWRFQMYMAMNEPSEEFGDGVGIAELRQNFDAVTGPADRHQALEYPSQNCWILDELTLWMTMGHLPNTTYGDFARADVLQNGEFDFDDVSADWIVCHYFSQNMNHIAEWFQKNSNRAAA